MFPFLAIALFHTIVKGQTAGLSERIHTACILLPASPSLDQVSTICEDSLSQEEKKGARFRYSNRGDKMNVILARAFNGNFRRAFRKWKREGIDVSNDKSQEIVFSRSKRYQHKLTDMYTQELRIGEQTHINYHGILGIDYKIYETQYSHSDTFTAVEVVRSRSNIHSVSTSINIPVKGSISIHGKIYTVQHYVISILYEDTITESYTIDSIAGHSLDQNFDSAKTLVQTTGTWKADVFYRTDEDMQKRHWARYGDAGWSYIVTITYYTTPEFIRVPTGWFGIPQWKKAHAYKMTPLDVVYRRR